MPAPADSKTGSTPAPETPAKHASVSTRLNTIFRTEGLSILLTNREDALRVRDLSAGYYASSEAPGHILPEISDFRSRLQRRGVTFQFTYKGESMADVGGGISRGMDYVHELTLQTQFDLGKLVGLDGWTIHTLLMERVGREVSHDRVGDYNISLMEVYSLSGHSVAHLTDMYAQKSFLHNTVDLAFGRMALTHVFATSPLLCSFMMTCSAPVAIKLDAGFSVYPKATWGGRVRLRPTRDTIVQVGAYSVSPLNEDISGWAWAGEKSTGLMLPVEFTWQPFFGRRKLAGHYVLGFAHDTTRYSDNIGSVPVGTARPHSGEARDTFYLEADQMLYRKGGANQMAGGYILGGYIHNTPDVSVISDEFYIGSSLLGIIPHRPHDRFGVMYSYYRISPRTELGERLRMDAGMPLGAHVNGPQTHAAVLEAYYGVPVYPGILIQPEFEYMMRPDETSHIPNAELVGLKVIGTL
ncbi:carbohydrate porin [Gluconacetobacter entanii]|uniref:carbohydrate porin n=1 Tax=Gluconacetobacter entanii TaxID=108528 RepID=UPI002236392F|nr:carbohydrate porin [Gluconacetobacter entanii]MCW4581424.1 carbohydrate porin [Gluconacetobacter entanii]MCW4584736.1 carbohydrate porin [Gluconacetobacter entanii]MCW4588150.1 carbohydrate porin [Gluconacetobacter entanii]